MELLQVKPMNREETFQHFLSEMHSYHLYVKGIITMITSPDVKMAQSISGDCTTYLQVLINRATSIISLTGMQEFISLQRTLKRHAKQIRELVFELVRILSTIKLLFYSSQASFASQFGEASVASARRKNIFYFRV